MICPKDISFIGIQKNCCHFSLTVSKTKNGNSLKFYSLFFTNHLSGSFCSSQPIKISASGVSRIQLKTSRTKETEPTKTSVNQCAPPIIRGSEKIINTAIALIKASLPIYFHIYTANINSIMPWSPGKLLPERSLAGQPLSWLTQFTL